LPLRLDLDNFGLIGDFLFEEHFLFVLQLLIFWGEFKEVLDSLCCIKRISSFLEKSRMTDMVLIDLDHSRTWCYL